MKEMKEDVKITFIWFTILLSLVSNVACDHLCEYFVCSSQTFKAHVLIDRSPQHFPRLC